MALTPEQIKQVKSQGFLLNRGTEAFNARVITQNGVLSAEQFANLSQAAKQFGNGKLTFTTRLTVEIAGVPYDKIPQFQQFIAQEGMVTGGTGAKIRPIVACKGTTCVFGLLDSQGIAKRLHERYFEGWGNVALPHKFKIAVGGCPNNCVKPDLNDFGVVGQRIPAFAPERCRGCQKCIVEASCPMGAAKVQDGKLHIDKTLCSNCGKCIEKCYFKAFDGGQNGFKLYIGGKWGKKGRPGTVLAIVPTEEDVYDMLERTLLYYKENANARERLGDMIDRIGVEKVRQDLLAGDVLSRREEILSK